ncbi:MAG: ATPase P [Lacunisphaera sp.]
MISIDIPDFGPLELHHLVSDYNGTLALDGILRAGVAERLRELSEVITIHVLTADTFGVAREQLAGLPITFMILPAENQAFAKLKYVEQLGASHVVAVGNGRNDRKMVAAAALGLALIQEEGLAAATLLEADLVSTCVLDVLDLLANPTRIKATLRS